MVAMSSHAVKVAITIDSGAGDVRTIPLPDLRVPMAFESLDDGGGLAVCADHSRLIPDLAAALESVAAELRAGHQGGES